jgi:very-short-patch-repair endonuclease
MAAALACGPGSVLSHRSAAMLLDLLRYSGRIHVSTTRRCERPGIVVHRVRHLPDEDRALVDGIPVTSVARTLCDIAPRVRPGQLTNAIDAAERQGVFDLRQFEHRKLPRALREALRLYRDLGFTRSGLEHRFATLCRARGLPQPSLNLWICGQEVDAVWLGRKVVVQLDSFETHHTRAAFEDDRRRDAVLESHGYSVVRVTDVWLDSDPDAVVAAVASLLTSSSSATALSTSSPNSSRSAIAS